VPTSPVGDLTVSPTLILSGDPPATAPVVLAGVIVAARDPGLEAAGVVAVRRKLVLLLFELFCEDVEKVGEARLPPSETRGRVSLLPGPRLGLPAGVGVAYILSSILIVFTFVVSVYGVYHDVVHDFGVCV
jgi:hypothetical protein